MARWKTLPFVFRCTEKWNIIKQMDCNKKMQEKAKIWIRLYNPILRKYTIAKGKQHKHS